MPIGPAFDDEFHHGRVAADDVLDLTRVDIDAPDRDHVIDPAADSAHDFHEWTAARTGSSYDLNLVAGAVADQGRSPAAEIRRHQLTIDVFQDALRLEKMHAVRLAAAGSRPP